MIIKSLDKGLRVLCYLASKPEAGPSAIARDLKFGKSTVIRLLQTMEVLGFVKQDGATGHYEMGTKVMQLAHTFLERQDSFASLADEQVRALWLRYGEAVSLYVREGDARVCIHRLESPSPLRYSVKLGEVRPLHVGAAGKSFLAYMPQDEVEALLARENVDPDRVSRLRHQIAEIRQSGVAYSFNERGTGGASIATPILNRRNEPIAVMSISGPLQRLSSARLEEMAEPLTAAARSIASQVATWSSM